MGFIVVDERWIGKVIHSFTSAESQFMPINCGSHLSTLAKAAAMQCEIKGFRDQAVQ